MKGIKFYRERGFEDVSKWIRILQFHRIRPCDIPESEIDEAVEFYFNESFKNDSPEMQSNEELKNSYKNAFLSGINNLRKSAGGESFSNKNKKISDFEQKGRLAAARWAASAEVDFAQSLDEEKLVELADTIFKIKYFEEKDPDLRMAFVNSFVEEVSLLISSVD